MWITIFTIWFWNVLRCPGRIWIWLPHFISFQTENYRSHWQFHDRENGTFISEGQHLNEIWPSELRFK
jgi:hypothetical protein